jgi:hypothetical protein
MLVSTGWLMRELTHGGSVAGASFENADLYCADFFYTNISRANFTGAKHLNSIVLKDACFNKGEDPVGLSPSQTDELLKDRKDCTPLVPRPTWKPTKCWQFKIFGLTLP